MKRYEQYILDRKEAFQRERRILEEQKRRLEADSHGDRETVTIEEIKLATARMLAEEFERRVQEGTL